MSRRISLTAIVLLALAPNAQANEMNCNAVFTDISRAISAELTKDPVKSAKMMRMALDVFDNCNRGNTGTAEELRRTVDAQLRRGLGGS